MTTQDVTLIHGSALKLPFADGRFDAVCLFDVIEHLPKANELPALLEAHRVLRKNGRLYLSTPHASPVHSPFDPIWYFGHRHYRKTSVIALLNSSGFRLDRLFVAGGLIECLDYLRHLFYRRVLNKEPPFVAPIASLVERSHHSNHKLGLSIFAVASKP
jgi:SAM-dependent methyltransferase